MRETQENVLLLSVTSTEYNASMPSVKERQIREAFSRYLSPSVMEQVLAPQELKPVRFDATVLQVVFHNLSDLEHADPNRFGEHVTAYTDPVIATAQAHTGLVDIVLAGKRMQIVFGNPFNPSLNHHAVDAVSAALSMQKLLEKVHGGRRSQGLPVLSLGIGIQTGEVIFAKFGGAGQFRYGHLGKPIDESREIANRSEVENGVILLGPETERYVGELVETEEAFVFTPQEGKGPITVYRVIRREEPEGQLR